MKQTITAAVGLTLLLAGSAAAWAPGAPANLCERNERVAFTCQAGAKVISLCGQGRALRYRFGRPGAVELAFPEDGTPAATAFRFSSTYYAGGGESRVHFRNGGVDYVLYTATTYGAQVDPGVRDLVVMNGVLVRRDRRTLANIRCTDLEDHDLSPLGAVLPAEAFDRGLDVSLPGDF